MKAHIRADAARAFREQAIKPFCKGQRIIPKTYLEYEKLLEKWQDRTLEITKSYGQGDGKRYVLAYPEPEPMPGGIGTITGIDVPAYLLDYVEAGA
jgi:hypothetical protein